MSAFRILVADNQPIFRFGLCSLLGVHEGWEVCGESSDGQDALKKCRQLRPDLVILDICMPKLNGVDTARQILGDNLAQRVLILTDVDSESAIRDCVEAGVRGWVFKSDGTAELCSAVQTLQREGFSFSSRVSDLILDGYRKGHRLRPTVAKIPTLSPREREVVQLLAEGKTSKEVAVALCISAKTVETHRSHVMSKLKLHSVAGLVLYAVRNEIVHVRVPPMLRFSSEADGRTAVAAQALA